MNREESRKIVKIYYNELLEKALPELIKEDSKISLPSDKLIQELEKFKDIAKDENVWIRYYIKENNIHLSAVHSLTHTSAEFHFRNNIILTDEVESYWYSDYTGGSEEVKEILSKIKLYNWKIESKTGKYWYNKTKTLNWILSELSQAIWCDFSYGGVYSKEYMNTNDFKEWELIKENSNIKLERKSKNEYVFSLIGYPEAQYTLIRNEGVKGD